MLMIVHGLCYRSRAAERLSLQLHTECEGMNMNMQVWPFEYATRGLKLAVCLSAP